MQKKHTTNTGLINGIFSGTYGTIWDHCTIDYDFKDFMNTILEAYQDRSSYILQELSIPWIKNLYFTGFYSPRQYNFENDELNIDMIIDTTAMKKNLMKVVNTNKESIHMYLVDNYSSYDGFMSFTPNTVDALITAIFEEKDSYHQAVAAFINFLTKDRFNIEPSVYEHYIENGYYGLDYKVVED